MSYIKDFAGKKIILPAEGITTYEKAYKLFKDILKHNEDNPISLKTKGTEKKICKYYLEILDFMEKAITEKEDNTWEK